MTRCAASPAAGKDARREKKGRYSPIDPVALSVFRGAASLGDQASPSLSAIAGDNAELLSNVARLWINDDDVVADVTYGRGAFWRNLPGLPHHCHDLAGDGVDCRRLPHAAESLDVVVLDPPYRPTHGSRRFVADLAEDYGLGTESLDSINDVIELYRAAMHEAYRVLRHKGRIIVKCQDLSYNHRLHLVSLDVFQRMLAVGFEFADQYILLNKTRLQSTKWQRQGRARRTHSVLWVGIKWSR